jgi:hypothetical protein
MSCPNCGKEGTLILMEDVAFSKIPPNTYTTSNGDIVEEIVDDSIEEIEDNFDYYFCSNCNKFFKG